MRTLIKVLLALLVSSCATTGGGNAKDQIAAVTDAWAAAFNSHDAGRITALYDADAVLWGTTSKTIATTPAAIAGYFNAVLPKFPDLRVKFGEQNIRVYGDLAVNSGYYTFAGPKAEAPARYTLVFRQHDGKWLIVDHHSSRVP